MANRFRNLSDAVSDSDAPTLGQMISGVTVYGNVNVGQQIACRSAVFDFFSALATTVDIIPAFGAGLCMIVTAMRVLYATRTGTISTTPIGKAGNNVSRDNFTPSISFVASAAQVTLSTPPGEFGQLNPAALTGKAATFGSPELTAAIAYELTTQAVGSSTPALTGRILSFGTIVPYPST